MPSPSADAVRRFAEDLRTARETRAVPLERLYEASRIPLDVLQSFERDGLADNRMFNRVYLRSLVRTYADTIGLPAPPVLDALDGALDGRYDGEVAALVAPPKADEAPGTEEVPAAPGSKLEAGPAPRSPRRKARPDETVPAASQAPEAEAPESLPGASGAPERPAPAEAGPASPARVRVEDTPLPPSYSPSIPSPDPSRYDYTPERRLPGWAMALLGVIVLALVGGGIVWWLSRDDAPDRPAPQQAEAPAARPDSARPAPPAAPVALPDTLRLVMAATGGPLRGIRVTIDADVRRPYWLEQGEQRTFAFRDSIRVNDPPAEATLTVQGQPVAASARRADGAVVIRRADLAARR